jgi:hypothetical protein
LKLTKNRKPNRFACLEKQAKRIPFLLRFALKRKKLKAKLAYPRVGGRRQDGINGNIANRQTDELAVIRILQV